MDAATEKLCKTIFSDGRVVDFDLSAWDRRLRLVVIAHDVLYEEGYTGKPINVDFVDLIKFSWESHHLGLSLAPGEFCVWNTAESHVKIGVNKIEVWIPSIINPAPSLRLECKDISISEAEYSDLDRVHPGWRKTGGAPLLRPSLEETSKLLRETRTIVRQER